MTDSQIHTRKQIEDKNSEYEQLYRNEVLAHSKREFRIDSSVDVKSIRYLKIQSIVIKNDENSAMVMREQMQKVLTSMWTIKKRFHMIFRFDGSSLDVFVGIGFSKNEKIDSSFKEIAISNNLIILRSIMESSVSGIEFQTRNEHSSEPIVYSFEDIDNSSFAYIGTFGGNPVVRKYQEQARNLSPMDEIVLGSSKIPWMYVVSAEPINDEELDRSRNELVEEITNASSYIQVDFSMQNADGTNVNMSTHKKYFGTEAYNTLLQAKNDVYMEAIRYGMWSVSALCFSSHQIFTNIFGGVLSAQMRSGDEDIKRPFPFKFFYNGAVRYNRAAYQAEISSKLTYFTGRELSQLCMLPVKDSCGFRVDNRADFDVNRISSGNLKIGGIVNGQRVTDVQYSLDLNSLNRHGLIIGLTGGGKTNTVKSLLYSINNLECPFMIIEPAKKEYYELYRMGMTDLQIYSVGSIDGNVLKINPFEVVKLENGKSVSLQSHIDTVFAAFKASFIMYTPMPYVLENAIYGIYADYGWNVETGENRFGKTEYPTIEDLYLKIEPTVKNMGYDEKMQNDLIGSMKARINSLRVGAKGRTLNVARSIPMEKLLDSKVVVELDDVGDEDAKAFIISLLLMQIQECRKVQDTVQLNLRHMLLIEEAHRLLKNVSSGSGENADPRGNAVEYFCNMLAELRSKGQGFLVIDQIPSKLAPDLVKNTNLKIIHRTVAREDRELVGGAMNMTEAQQNYLSCLKQGFAAVYSEGDNHPKLVKLPYAGNYENDERYKYLKREEIIRLSGKNCVKQEQNEHFFNQKDCNPICRHCRECNSWKNPKKGIYSKISSENADKIISKMLSMPTIDEAIVWMHEKINTITHQSPKEQKETEKCIMAYLFSYFEDEMDYTMRASLSASMLELIYKYD